MLLGGEGVLLWHLQNRKSITTATTEDKIEIADIEMEARDLEIYNNHFCATSIISKYFTVYQAWQDFASSQIIWSI